MDKDKISSIKQNVNTTNQNQNRPQGPDPEIQSTLQKSLNPDKIEKK